MKSYCGVLAIIGESNAGKSQLLNAFLQAPVAVVHHKRNLTRERMRAVITQGERQLVIEDTAGLAGLVAPRQSALAKKAEKSSGGKSSGGKSSASKSAKNSASNFRVAVGRDYWTRRMREEALNAARSADLKLWIVDATRGERALLAAISLAQQAGYDDGLQESTKSSSTKSDSTKLDSTELDSTELKKRSFFALNKIDLISDKRLLLPLAARLEEAQCCSEVFMLSAKNGYGVARARENLLQALPPAPFLYEKDGDTRECETIACEITRGVLYDRLHEELPYDAQVKNELVQKNEDGSLQFAQRLHLRRESQRRILLAQEGRLLQNLERIAERALQKHFSCEVQLNLHLPRARDW